MNLRIAPSWLLLASALLTGCADGPVGSYRVDSSVLLEASCNGATQARVQAWSEALALGPASGLDVGRAGPTDPLQLQLLREDASVLYAQVTEVADGRYTGTRVVTDATTLTAGLGADFSALLEAGGVCTFDLTVDVEFAGRDDAFEAVDATVRVTLDEADGGTPCAINVCAAEIRVAAAKSSGINPGVEE